MSKKSVRQTLFKQDEHKSLSAQAERRALDQALTVCAHHRRPLDPHFC